MNNKVSIITVVYNGVNEIEQTILSVINQTYKNIEYIIIDGASSDGTVDVIKKYEDSIAYWISKPDKGIYDAMNQGIDYASGKYILFMNAGDLFYDASVVANASILFYDFPDVIYGNTIVNYKWGKYIVKPGKIKELNSRLPFCHQSAFVKADLMKEKKFDLTRKISADFNFFNLIFTEKKRFIYYNGTIAIYDSIYGFSSKNSFQMHKENLQISESNQSTSKFKRQTKLIKLLIINIIPSKLLFFAYQIYFVINRRYHRL